MDSISYGYNEVMKSKFHCYIFNITNVDEAKSILTDIKKENKKARHILYAYKLKNGIVKCHNDKEPCNISSVISILEYNDLDDVLVVMVRYYGGSKLGASKLLRSYLNSFKEAINKLK